MATIKVTKGSNEPKFLPNCEIVNGKVVVALGGGKYKPFWNGHKVEKDGVKANISALGVAITADQVAKNSEYLFSLGENEGGYTVEVYVAPKKTAPRASGYSSIFGASSDGGH